MKPFMHLLSEALLPLRHGKGKRMNCDCSQKMDEFRHEWTCALWDEDDFFDGLAIWRGNQLMPAEIVRSFEERVVDVEEHLERENLEWECPWTSSDELFKDGELMTEAERDAALFEKYDKEYVDGGGIVDCFCPSSKKFSCVCCGVERLDENSPWCRKVGRWSDEEHDKYPTSCKCKNSKKVICGVCHVQRARPNGELKPYDTYPWTYYTPAVTNGYNNYSNFQPKCRHRQHQVTMPSGIKVYASSAHGGEANGIEPFVPDVHVMLDQAQKPKIVALYMDWQDHGLPRIPDSDVIATAQAMLAFAREGKSVEFGCIGGHGRTGCLLGIMYLLDKGPALVKDGDEVIDWVRKAICDNCIEGQQQEDYMEYMRLLLTGHAVERPEKPKPVSKPGSEKTELKKIDVNLEGWD